MRKGCLARSTQPCITRLSANYSAGVRRQYLIQAFISKCTRISEVAACPRSSITSTMENTSSVGRFPLPIVLRLNRYQTTGDQRCFWLVHDSSRTGAPLLAWNIARRLAEAYNVVALLMRGGVLEDAFKAVSAVTVGPMVWEEWRPEEMRRVAERLVAAYDPLYTVANSIESHLLVPALAKLGVPSVALVHEFAAYTRPVARMRDVLDWATHVVYPATLVAQSSFDAFPAFAHRRGVHVLSQGLVELPRTQSETLTAEDRRGRARDIASLMRPKDAADSFVVLGLGAVQLRKGVDLFLAAAANARRLAPELRFRFVFIGDGYDPVGDSSYSVYLAEQIIRSGLTGTVVMLDAVEDLDPAYDNADAFLLSSRLDPQPNVGIDAVTRGIPTVCFEGASGTAEILARDPLTRSLVVPHLDAHAAAEVLCRLARDPSALADIRVATARLGAAAYDTAAYVHQMDVWGRAAAAALQAKDLQTLAEARIIDADLALPPDVLAPGALGVERHVLQQWAVVGTSFNQVANSQFRRPCAGFHPQAYAKAHPEACCEGAANPLAHWLRAGRPYGHWTRQVFSPLHEKLLVPEPVRVALHAHFYYVVSAPYLAELLANNVTSCDLFLSTNTQSKAAQLRSVFASHRGAVDIRVMPNRGRDIGPLFTGLAEEITNGGYDMFGHVHGKQSLGVDATMGSVWRDFLWDNLIGSTYPMLDLAAAAIATQPDIGLLIAEDPHLVGWDQNRELAETLASQMGIAGPLDDFFDFPLGTMFWARPHALRPLLALNLAWEDYPIEPIAEDGTLLHALERLLPFAARQAGLRVAGLRAPGTTW